MKWRRVSESGDGCTPTLAGVETRDKRLLRRPGGTRCEVEKHREGLTSTRACRSAFSGKHQKHNLLSKIETFVFVAIFSRLPRLPPLLCLRCFSAHASHTLSPFQRRTARSHLGANMGFANIWATKQECNGKGQRRWYVSSTTSSCPFPGAPDVFLQRVFHRTVDPAASGPTLLRAMGRFFRRDRGTITGCVKA